MYVCLYCGNIFEVPLCWEERHNLDSPPYEQRSGSPCCGETYAEAYICDACSDWITTENYVKIGNERYCQNCYQIYELGEE